jgi:hypothetical protein
MDGLITEDDKRQMNDKENHYNNGADEDHSQAFFLGYHQVMAYHCWLSFRWKEVVLFQRFKVSHFVCLV